MFSWNAAWTNWFADPSSLPDGELKSFVQSGQFKKWLYTPVDSECPNGRLTEAERRIFLGYDRVLAYTKWGAEVIDRTMESDPLWVGPKTAYLPLGTDGKIFYPRSRKEARRVFASRIAHKGKGVIADDVTWIGIVATNTPRKDWALGFEVCAELLRRGVNVGLWAHTDQFRKNWDLISLAESFGMRQRTCLTSGNIPDEDMAWGYAACDCTLGIGSGEGWGLPLSESLAMGVPCITGDYSGQTDFVPDWLRVKPAGFRYEGYWANKRPVFNAAEWAGRVQSILGTISEEKFPLLYENYFWKGCWPDWERWFREGASKVGAAIDFEEIRRLNYDHHRRMSEMHIQRKAEEAESGIVDTCEKLDDNSYRSVLAEVPKGGSLLELGSASGGQWPLLREWSNDLTGIDLYEPFVRASQEKGLNIHLGFVEKMPFPDESFSAVVSRHVMEHVGDIQTALSEIKRVLKPGGYVASVTPLLSIDNEPAHIQKLSIEEWEEQYIQAGFVIVSSAFRQFHDPEAHIVARKASE
jgi:glycosyltransferase involved in cell wall biosynthesis/SAM-dependent methyltransferase